MNLSIPTGDPTIIKGAQYSYTSAKELRPATWSPTNPSWKAGYLGFRTFLRTCEVRP